MQFIKPCYIRFRPFRRGCGCVCACVCGFLSARDSQPALEPEGNTISYIFLITSGFGFFDVGKRASQNCIRSALFDAYFQGEEIGRTLV